MNTTAPRDRAGKPYVMPLHRAMPIDFVLPDEDERQAIEFQRLANQARGMQNAIPRAEPEPAADATKDMKASEFAFWFWSRAMWTGCVFGLGILYARTFS